MTQEHPITPPPELVQAFLRSNPSTPAEMTYEQFIATRFARWGADQELEACKEWVSWRHSRHESDELLFARRPKPPSLKEQALQALYRFDDTEGHKGLTPEQIAEDFVLIRRALESLPD